MATTHTTHTQNDHSTHYGADETKVIVRHLNVPDASGTSKEYDIATVCDLKIGDKYFDGSECVEITAADLGLSNALHFIGISTTDPSTGTVTIDDSVHTGVSGDVVLYAYSASTDRGEDTYKEYVYTGSAWELLGDADHHSVRGHTHKVTHKPVGTVSQPTFTGKAATLTGTFSGTAASHKHSVTAAGGVTVNSAEADGTITNTFTNGGTISSGNVSGAIHRHTFTGTSATYTVKGTPAGSVTVNETTSTTESVTPTFTESTTATGANTHTHKFTGTAGTVSVSGTPKGSVSTTVKPEGTVASTFTGVEHTHSHTYTPAGTVKTTVKPEGSISKVITAISTANDDFIKTVSLSGGTHSTGSVAQKIVGALSGDILTLSTPQVSVVTSATDVSISTTTAKAITSVTGTSAAPTFTGTSKSYTGTFTGTEGTTSEVTHTCEGTVASTFTGTSKAYTGTFTGTAFTSTGSFTPAGTIDRAGLSVAVVMNPHTHTGTFTGSELTSTGSNTPKGTISTVTLASEFTPIAHNHGGSFTGSAVETTEVAITPAGTITMDSYTPAGTVSKPTFSGTSATLTTTGDTDPT